MTSFRIIACIVASMAAGGLSIGRAQPTIPLDPEKAISQYVIDQWTTEHGLPMKRVSSVTQSADGYIWLGTQEGLVRFDGFSFTVYDKYQTGLQSNTITAILEDSRGTLWIGTVSGLARYASGRFEAMSGADGWSNLYVSALLEDDLGQIWVSSFDRGLGLVDGVTIKPLDLGEALPSRSISSMYLDAAGSVWIGTTGAGLMRYAAGSATNYSVETGLPSNEITAIGGNGAGEIWIGTKGGLVILRDSRLQTYTIENGLPSNLIRAFQEDAAGTLWIGTEGGLSRLRNGRLEFYNGREGLKSVFALHEDREGSLWIGTQRGGLFRLQDGKFTTFTTEEGLGSNSAYSIYEDDHANVWVGTLGGGVSRLHEDGISTLTVDDGLATDDIVSLYGSADGTLWFGTHGLGLIRYQNGRLRQFTNEDGLPGSGIYAIFEDSRGRLWLGAGRAGLVQFDGRRFTTYTTADGLTDNSVTVITEGPRDYLWVGTYSGGLNLLKGGKILRSFTARNGLPNDYVSSIYRDEDGILWIATREGGLTRLKDGKLHSLNVEQGLFNDTILQILEDDHGYFWMSTNRGLFRARKAEVNAVLDGDMVRVESIVYDRSDGLKTFEFNGGSQPAGWKDRHGRLWFVSSKGVVRVDPNRLPRNEVPPKVVVERVLVGDESIRTDAVAVLEPGRNSIEIDFVGLSYMASDEVEYRYRLDGVDRNWIEAGGRRQAFYTNLPPGHFTFEVMARNADGVWSEGPATFSFRLQPYFHQTPWFALLVVMLLVCLGAVSYRMRIRHLKARQIELERTVAARTRDLREEKRKVEESKAVIEEQTEQLRELDRVKTRFFGNISHEFRTPLTLNIGPLENALAGVYGPVPEVLRLQLAVMLRNARRLLRLINQLLDLSKLESGRLELHLRHLDLVSFAEGIVTSFSAFAQKAQLNLNFKSNAESLGVNFDAEAMEKVLFNLISNAVKFTPSGGRIDVSVVAGQTSGIAEVVVRDTGLGIPAADLPFVFDRFHQVEGSSSHVQQGTGIGLALVKELVELHDGEIDVESEVGYGSTFRIRLPMRGEADVPVENADEALGYSQKALSLADFDGYADDIELERTPEQEPISGDGSTYGHVVGASAENELILVVDDNPDIRQYMIGCLSSRYRILAAKNGEEALDRAKTSRPDLIISDVMMPRMTGYDLCRAVRSDETISMTPIIFVTSKAAVDDKIEGLDAGADDYLPKPFNAEELFARVRNLLTLRKQQRDVQMLNEQLLSKNVELEQASDLKSQLLRIAAHDLKNPLNNIREFANLIREELDADSEASAMLRLIERSSNQMFGLISEILESEALESGQLHIDRAPLDLGDVAAGVVEANLKQAERKDQSILFDAPGDPECYVVEGSREWLTEAMDNLVSNAIKYSPAGKKIWVSVRRSGSRIEFQVRDEGPGLTMQDKDRVFQKFQRLSAKPTGGETSTGLGLSIVKQIIELHNGEVEVESERGLGSAFIIRLDAAEKPVAA